MVHILRTISDTILSTSSLPSSDNNSSFMHAQATDRTIWKTNLWDFFSSYKNIWICAGRAGFTAQQIKLLSELHLVHFPQTWIKTKLFTSKQLNSQRDN